jgi:hypothetical protein
MLRVSAIYGTARGIIERNGRAGRPVSIRSGGIAAASKPYRCADREGEHRARSFSPGFGMATPSWRAMPQKEQVAISIADRPIFARARSGKKP